MSLSFVTAVQRFRGRRKKSLRSGRIGCARCGFVGECSTIRVNLGYRYRIERFDERLACCACFSRVAAISWFGETSRQRQTFGIAALTWKTLAGLFPGFFLTAAIIGWSNWLLPGLWTQSVMICLLMFFPIWIAVICLCLLARTNRKAWLATSVPAILGWIVLAGFQQLEILS